MAATATVVIYANNGEDETTIPINANVSIGRFVSSELVNK